MSKEKEALKILKAKVNSALSLNPDTLAYEDAAKEILDCAYVIGHKFSDEAVKQVVRSTTNGELYELLTDNAISDREWSISVRTIKGSDDIIFKSCHSAKQALKNMKNIVANYGIVLLSDMCDLADIRAPYTVCKLGWTSVDMGLVERCKGGYFIRLPNPMKIE